MKKVLFLFVVLVVGFYKVSAYEVEGIFDGQKEIREIELKKGWRHYIFALDGKDDYTEDDKRILNNFAYVGDQCSNEICVATTQLLIWEYLYSGKNYVLKNNGKEIYNEVSKKFIVETLASIESSISIDGEYFEAYLFDELWIDSDVSLANYKSSIFENEYRDNSLILKKITKPGSYNVNFEYDYNIQNNEIYATDYSYGSFSINIEVIGNIGIINSSGDIKFQLIDEENNKIQKLDIIKGKNEFYYPSGMEYRLVDISENTLYEKISDIYLEDDPSKPFEINVVLNKRKAKVKINSVIASYNNQNNIQNRVADITIYDVDKKEIDHCLSLAICLFDLEYGNYYIKDNITGDIKLYEITKDIDIILKQYYINGIISNVKVDKIIKDNAEYEFIYQNGVIYFKDFIYPDKYGIIVDDIIYEIDFNDQNKYLYEKDQLIYKFIIENNSGINKGEVIIQIPDTGIEYYEIINYTYKKKYYINSSVIFA